MAEQTIIWRGASGKGYKYWTSDMDSSFKDAPGNYVFAKGVSPNRGLAQQGSAELFCNSAARIPEK